MGEWLLARKHLELALSFYDREGPILIGFDAGVNCLSYMALVLWALGYPDSAAARGVVPEAALPADPEPARRPKRPVRSVAAALRVPRPLKRAVQERHTAIKTHPGRRCNGCGGPGQACPEP